MQYIGGTGYNVMEGQDTLKYIGGTYIGYILEGYIGGTGYITYMIQGTSEYIYCMIQGTSEYIYWTDHILVGQDIYWRNIWDTYHQGRHVLKGIQCPLPGAKGPTEA